MLKPKNSHTSLITRAFPKCALAGASSGCSCHRCDSCNGRMRTASPHCGLAGGALLAGAKTMVRKSQKNIQYSDLAQEEEREREKKGKGGERGKKRRRKGGRKRKKKELREKENSHLLPIFIRVGHSMGERERAACG